MYYLFAESRGNPASDPTILWLQGGPGRYFHLNFYYFSSSLFGFFVENGPVSVDSTGSFSQNAFSWNQFANVIWIDQPVGTGFSFVNDSNGYMHSEDVLAHQLLNCLDGFFSLHPKYASAVPTFFFVIYLSHFTFLEKATQGNMFLGWQPLLSLHLLLGNLI